MDDLGEMVRDLPGVWEGQSRTYGCYDGNSVRTMTAQEVEWNKRMVKNETNNPHRMGRIATSNAGCGSSGRSGTLSLIHI